LGNGHEKDVHGRHLSKKKKKEEEEEKEEEKKNKKMMMMNSLGEHKRLASFFVHMLPSRYYDTNSIDKM